MSARDDKNSPDGGADTGHVWDDDLRDLTNQPPQWWLLGLYASGIWVIGYVLLYPSLPLANSHTKGLMGWTAIKEYKQDKQAIDAVREPYEKRIREMDAKDILADKELVNYVTRSAKVLFGDNCSPCHGAGGQGNPGYPVLADDDWLYEGGIAHIEETITTGRHGMMTAHGASLSAQQIEDVAKHVLAMSSGGEYAPGKEVFMNSDCVGCHGTDARGNTDMGAANLTDSIWRFSGTLEAVKYTITHGVNDPGDPETRSAQMPNFGTSGRLSATDIKKLAVYVHELGGGK
ncbi:MAG: cytochrome-c oxidase, cbb3-type subunit III [Gallionella sp.]